MRIFKYLFRNYKFYIQTVLTSVLFIVTSLFFVERLTTVHSINKTLNNTQCRFIAYDSWPEDNNTYKYYGNKIDVYVSDPNALINVTIAQFIEGNVYDSYSYLNSKNVVDGSYSNLNKNEVGLPISFKTKYNVKIGSVINVDSHDCTIKYFHSDFYQLESMKPSYPVQTIFVGSDTITSEPDSYLKFNPDDFSHHDQLFGIRNNLAKEYRNSEISIVVLMSIIYFVIVIIIVDYFRAKNMRNMLSKSLVNGENRLLLKSSLLCSVYIAFIALLAFVSTIWNPLKILLPYMLVTLLANLIISVVVYIIYIERRKKTWIM